MLSGVASAQTVTRVASPDGKVVVQFVLQGEGRPAYSVSFDGKPVILESRLGFLPAFNNGFELTGSSSSTHTGHWTNQFGELESVPDNYSELQVDLTHGDRQMTLTFRAYNEAAALRYSFPGKQNETLQFSAETTEFRFPDNTFGYEEHATEGEYQRAPVSQIHEQCERPLTLELDSGLFASLMEAANTRYPRMLLGPLSGVSNAMVSSLGGSTSNVVRGNQPSDGSVTLKSGDATPWRLLLIGRTPGELLEHNYIVLNLNPPSTIADTSWIRPGKVMRCSILTTASGEAIVDLANQLGVNYVMYDANWYGRDQTSDATQIRQPNLDLKAVAAYAHAHGVGAGLYVDARQVQKQRDVLFPLFKNDWAFDFVKIGFVPVGSQADTTWITETVQKAAEFQLMLNLHDGYRQTGLVRTYPNLMTVEGIRGNEHMPSARHNCTLPFARYVLGTGDYTVCYLNPRIQTSHAHQLAMGVVSFSPLQCLYWYDTPDMYSAQRGGVPPELEFWRHMPTVWSETRVIAGKIGQYASIARRKGDAWFIGTINGDDARTLNLSLSFLDVGKHYTAHIYSDDDNAPTRTKVSVQARPVDAKTVLDTPLKAAGGQAVWIEPQP
ncbi:MAG: glycoside hydrolase family 97 N-terminal domain-containing protein [Phycisphaerae bacterium]|nr:glycoside hydrolase family 97 N-terminal domain-containing protein [Phycisphaerae bacterium]